MDDKTLNDQKQLTGELEDALLDSPVSTDVDENNTTLTTVTEGDPSKVKAPELNLDLNKLSLKRLSGAQRRKIAIQAAKEKGEPIRYKHKRPAHKRLNSSREEGSHAHSGSRDSASTSRERSPSAPSNATSKRTRSDGSTPDTHQTAKRRRDNESNTAFKDALTAIKIAIVPQDFPETRLTEEQADEVQMALLNAIKPGPEGSGPSFNNCYFDKGAVILSCRSEGTKTWVQTEGPKLKTWQDAKLKVGLAKDLLQTAKVIMLAPKNLRMKTPKEILQLVKTQNAGLKTDEWHVINHAKDENSVTMVLNIDELSLKSLTKSGMKACLGLGKASFRVIATAKGNKDGSNIHPPKAVAGEPTTQ